MAPIDGLKVSGSYYVLVKWVTKMTDRNAEGGSLAANYSIGQLSVGYGETLHAPAQRMNTHQQLQNNNTMKTMLFQSVLQ